MFTHENPQANTPQTGYDKPLFESPKMFLMMLVFDAVLPALYFLAVKAFFPLAFAHMQSSLLWLIPGASFCLNILANALAIKNIKEPVNLFYAMLWSFIMLFTPTTIFILHNNHPICDGIKEAKHAVANFLFAIIATELFRDYIVAHENDDETDEKSEEK